MTTMERFAPIHTQVYPSVTLDTVELDHFEELGIHYRSTVHGGPHNGDTWSYTSASSATTGHRLHLLTVREAGR